MTTPLTAEELAKRLLYTAEIRTRHHENVNDPIVKESREAADLITAQAAEIERLKQELTAETEIASQQMGLASRFEARAEAAEAKVAAMEKMLNTPEVIDFVKAVQLEAAHQRERWGSDHDAGKTDADWFWLVGYLAGKALHNPPNEMPPDEARLHRIVATAAALANWHLATLGLTNMRPGIEPPIDAALGAKP